MQSYNVSTLITDIKIALDQNKVSTQLSGVSDLDTLTLDEIIQSKVADAVRLVELDAPMHLLDGGQTVNTPTISWFGTAGYGGGYVALPSDFLRLVVFKMSDWLVPVFRPIPETDPKYLMQKSSFRGISGNPQNPVCVLVTKPGGRVLEFYTSVKPDAESSTPTVEMFSYLPIPTISNSQISMCPALYSAVVYYAAGMVAQTIGSNELATSLFTMSSNLAK